MTTDEQAQHDPGAVGLVDWARTGRRVRASALVLGGGAVLAWLVAGLAGDGLALGDLGGWVGLALALLFLVELVVVGGAALGGMLRAGARGERLSTQGVGLFPPRIPGLEERLRSGEADEGQDEVRDDGGQ